MLDAVLGNSDITRPEFAKSFATIAVNARLKNPIKKTLKIWNILNIDLDYYLGLEPVEIDEEMFLYLLEVVPVESSFETRFGSLGQTGEANDKFDGIYFHSTVNRVNGKYYYLGILPEFKK